MEMSITVSIFGGTFEQRERKGKSKGRGGEAGGFRRFRSLII